MKIKRTLKYVAAILVGAAAWSCDAMWDTSVDVPFGYGGNLGVSVSTPIYGGYNPWYNGWNNWNGWPAWGGIGWNPGPIVRPIRPVITPVRPPMRPGTTPPSNGGNWRPPVNNPPVNNNPPANRPVTLPPVQGSVSTPPVQVSPVTRPGRH